MKKDIQQDRLSIDELMRNSLATKEEKVANFNKFFKFLAGFHHYSHYNNMLVYLQNKDVKMFGTSGFWKKKYNRTIKPDAQPYIILAPMGPTMIAYDITETEGEDDVQKVLDTLFSKKAEGTMKATQMKTTVEAVTEWGIKVEKVKLQDNQFGQITTKENQSPQITLNL